MRLMIANAASPCSGCCAASATSLSISSLRRPSSPFPRANACSAVRPASSATTGRSVACASSRSAMAADGSLGEAARRARSIDSARSEGISTRIDSSPAATMRSERRSGLHGCPTGTRALTRPVSRSRRRISSVPGATTYCPATLTRPRMPLRMAVPARGGSMPFVRSDRLQSCLERSRASKATMSVPTPRTMGVPSLPEAETRYCGDSHGVPGPSGRASRSLPLVGSRATISTSSGVIESTRCPTTTGAEDSQGSESSRDSRSGTGKRRSHSMAPSAARTLAIAPSGVA